MVQPFALEGSFDAREREWIGNAAPSAAAQGMAEEIGEALLLAMSGETFMLSDKAIRLYGLDRAFTCAKRCALLAEVGN